ncbi:hypothetical protein [Marinibactrum halimedae]|uniref:GAF domain-containing protein n=1 Tax=Marinibactrum halimedae TaxID=1444977 RepID=A0AA37T3E0_9GAMM|nr:hypothetical protein [Marinibactrum halimedae]MCD9459731.1 hypothetical protein [Marinibactrum halimedae]GLS24512.1 hypothetical protein GCM10007877_02240 [Marinibactrum halimedae]
MDDASHARKPQAVPSEHPSSQKTDTWLRKIQKSSTLLLPGHRDRLLQALSRKAANANNIADAVAKDLALSAWVFTKTHRLMAANPNGQSESHNLAHAISLLGIPALEEQVRRSQEHNPKALQANLGLCNAFVDAELVQTLWSTLSSPNLSTSPIKPIGEPHLHQSQNQSGQSLSGVNINAAILFSAPLWQLWHIQPGAMLERERRFIAFQRSPVQVEKQLFQCTLAQICNHYFSDSPLSHVCADAWAFIGTLQQNPFAQQRHIIGDFTTPDSPQRSTAPESLQHRSSQCLALTYLWVRSLRTHPQHPHTQRWQHWLANQLTPPLEGNDAHQHEWLHKLWINTITQYTLAPQFPLEAHPARHLISHGGTVDYLSPLRDAPLQAEGHQTTAPAQAIAISKTTSKTTLKTETITPKSTAKTRNSIVLSQLQKRLKNGMPTLHSLMHALVSGLHEGLGLEVCTLALLNSQRDTLRWYYYQGVTRDDELIQTSLPFPNATGEVFNQLLDSDPPEANQASALSSRYLQAVQWQHLKKSLPAPLHAFERHGTLSLVPIRHYQKAIGILMATPTTPSEHKRIIQFSALTTSALQRLRRRQ